MDDPNDQIIYEILRRPVGNSTPREPYAPVSNRDVLGGLAVFGVCIAFLFLIAWEMFYSGESPTPEFDNTSPPGTVHTYPSPPTPEELREQNRIFQEEARMYASNRIQRTPNRQWDQWMSDGDVEQQMRLYAQIPSAWAAADREALHRGLLARREQLALAPVDLDELDAVEKQIEEIEERKFRELANELGVPVKYLKAVHMRGVVEGW